MRNIKLLIISVMLIIMCGGCSNTKDIDIDRTLIITDINTLYNEALQVLNGEDTNELNYFSDDFVLDTNDYYKNTIEDSYRNYLSQDAYYIQLGKYMYRFQFNNDGIVKSYIKYNLEA